MRRNIILSGCNAFSAAAYIYSAISTKDRPVIATNIESDTDREVPADKKGGIIVFPQEVNDVQLITNKLDSVCWTTGRFLKGLHVSVSIKFVDGDTEEQTEGDVAGYRTYDNPVDFAMWVDLYHQEIRMA